MLTPEAITAILTALTALIGSLAALAANRSRRTAAEQRALRRRVRLLERQLLALVEHTFSLELELARAGRKVPHRPLILEQLDDDASTDDEPSGGRHAHRR